MAKRKVNRRRPNPKPKVFLSIKPPKFSAKFSKDLEFSEPHMVWLTAISEKMIVGPHKEFMIVTNPPGLLDLTKENKKRNLMAR
jgi:hypothetical protein